MLIVGDLMPFFEYGKGIVAIDEGAWVGKPPSTMSSIFKFELGTQSNLVTKLQSDPIGLEKHYRYEQNFIHGEGDRIDYWPGEWLVSYKRHLRRPVGLDLILPPKKPGQDVRVVVFHGDPRPRDLAKSTGGNPDKLPHYVKTPVHWVREYWAKYGSDG